LSFNGGADCNTFPGCGLSKTVKAEDELEYAHVIADGLMYAFNKGDYETYSKDLIS